MSAVGLAQSQPVLTVTRAANMPGEQTSIALLLKAGGVEIDTLRIKFKLPPELEYIRASPGVSVEMAGVEMTTEFADSLEIELTADQSGIPEGVLVSVDLEIKSDSNVGKTVKVELTATAKLASGEEITVGSEGGEVEITAQPPPAISCFFYMH